MKYLPDGNAMTNKEKVNQVQETAFITSHYICKNYHDAQDIAQDVSLKFLLRKADKNKPIIDHIRWSKVVARHETYKRMKKQRKTSDIGELENIEDNISNISSSSDQMEIELIPELPNLKRREVKKLLNEADYTIYKEYIKHKGKTGELAKALNLTINSATNKIYRMKRNLKATYLTKAGYVGGKDIIDYQTNKNIIKFVKMFATKMQQNDLQSLHKYFEQYDIKDIPQMDIAEFKAYEIRLLKKNKFEMLYGYEDSKEKPNFVYLDFVLDKKNYIRIVDMTIPPMFYEIDMTLKEARKILPAPVKGGIPLTGQETYELLTNSDKES